MLKKLFSARINEFVSPDVSLLLLRVGAAALMMTHGIPKLMRMLDGNFDFSDPIGIGSTASLIMATFAEAFCALLVILGLWTRAALIPLIFTMFVIVFIVHAGDPFSRIELALFFLITFIVLFLTGPGKYSLDHKLFQK